MIAEKTQQILCVSGIVAFAKWRVRAGKHEPVTNSACLSQNDVSGP